MGEFFGGLFRRRMHALAVAGCFVIGCGGAEWSRVSEATWTDSPWPLTVTSGRLSCEGTSARPVPWFESPDGRMWPLNGIAMGEAASRGGVFQTEITPIHAPDADLMAEMREAGVPEGGPIVRISVDALRQRAFALCE